MLCLRPGIKELKNLQTKTGMILTFFFILSFLSERLFEAWLGMGEDRQD